MKKEKKPFYKRWWFIALVVIYGGSFVIGAVLGIIEGIFGPDVPQLAVAETQIETVSDVPDQEISRAMPETEPAQEIEPVSEAAPAVEQPVEPEPDPQPAPKPEPEPQPAPQPEPEPQEVVSIIDTEPEPEPAPEPQPEPQPAPKRSTFAVANTGRTVSLDPDTVVWKSETGSKFHTHNDCGNMNPDKARQITVAEAEKLGLKACEKCY